MTNEEKLSDNTIVRFFCFECRTGFNFPLWEDPTSSSGCCKNCGSSKWQITKMTGEVID
jgi:hypothetical protein